MKPYAKCALYRETPILRQQGGYVISTDEKTRNQIFLTVALVAVLLLCIIPDLGARIAINAASLQLMACMSSGQTCHAGELLSAALDVWPTNDALLRLQGIFRWTQGDNAEAVAALNKVDHPDVNTRFFLAHALYDSGQQDEAIRLYRALGASRYFVGSNPDLALLIAPFDVDLLYRLGEWARERGKAPEAAGFFHQALSLDAAESQRSLLAQAFLYEYEHRWTDAEKTYKRAIQLYPNDPIAYRCLGHMYYLKLGQGVPALEWYDRAIALPPSCYLSCLFAGDILINSQPARALDYFLRSVRLFAPNPRGWIGAGLAQVALGNNVAAIRSLHRAKKQMKALTPLISYGLGKAHLQLGEWETAVDYLRRSLESGNRAADVYLSLARAYCVGRRYVEAAATYRALLEVEPENPLALSGLQAALSGADCP
jgi:tetratricopeptide (TPR) repeat protein